MPLTFTTATMKLFKVVKLVYFFTLQYKKLFLGIEYPFIPDTKGVPIVADMSSNLMTRKFDVSKVNQSSLIT